VADIFSNLVNVVICGQEVYLDRSLAKFYEVKLSVLRCSVSKNHARFSNESLIKLSCEDVKLYNAKYAFTASGVAMLSFVLRSDKAARISVEIIRSTHEWLSRDENAADYAQVFMPLWEAELKR